MTRASRFQILLLAAVALSIPGRGSAAGFGGYFEYLYADGETDTGRNFLGDLDYKTDKYGFGLAFDTNLAQDQLLNYRLTMGYQRSDRDYDDFGDVDGNGFSINNSLGFGLWSTPILRLWAGPSLRLGLDVLDTDTGGLDVADFSVGGGPSLGVNVHAGENVSVGLTAGYQYLYVAEFIDADDVGDDNENANKTYNGREHLVTVNLTVFFRTSGDQFD